MEFNSGFKGLIMSLLPVVTIIRAAATGPTGVKHVREVFLQTSVLFGMDNCVIHVISCIENCNVVKRLKTWSSNKPHESNIDISSKIRPNDSLSSDARTSTCSQSDKEATST